PQARAQHGGLAARALGSEVAADEAPRTREAAIASRFRRHDDVVRVDAVGLAEALAKPAAARGALPPPECVAERLPGRGPGREVEQPEVPQVQEYLRDAPGQEDAHGRVRAVGERVDEAGDTGGDALPFR